MVGRQASSFRTVDQRGTRRHIRGSLITGRIAPGNSAESARLIRLRKATAAEVAYQSRSNSRQSFQALPAEARISSFSALMTSDSQKPRTLSNADGMSVFGAHAPRQTSAPETAEVPLRCMPSTRSGDGPADRNNFRDHMAITHKKT